MCVYVHTHTHTLQPPRPCPHAKAHTTGHPGHQPLRARPVTPPLASVSCTVLPPLPQPVRPTEGLTGCCGSQRAPLLRQGSRARQRRPALCWLKPRGRPWGWEGPQAPLGGGGKPPRGGDLSGPVCLPVTAHLPVAVWNSFCSGISC